MLCVVSKPTRTVTQPMWDMENMLVWLGRRSEKTMKSDISFLKSYNKTLEIFDWSYRVSLPQMYITVLLFERSCWCP